jgi:hypothetical protein
MTNNNLLADEIRQARKPRLDVALPSRPDVPDDAVETRSREIGGKWGASTQLPPVQTSEPDQPTAPLISVRFDCPDYLDRAISVKAAEQGVTKTFLILSSLKAAGYAIAERDLVIDRRKFKKR